MEILASLALTAVAAVYFMLKLAPEFNDFIDQFILFNRESLDEFLCSNRSCSISSFFWIVLVSRQESKVFL